MEQNDRMIEYINDRIQFKMKYWREYYLVKCIEKHFGEINIGDLDESMTHIHYCWWTKYW